MQNAIIRKTGPFLTGEGGATSIEYALLAAILGIGIIGAAGTMGPEVSQTFDNAAAGMRQVP